MRVFNVFIILLLVNLCFCAENILSDLAIAATKTNFSLEYSKENEVCTLIFPWGSHGNPTNEPTKSRDVSISNEKLSVKAYLPSRLVSVDRNSLGLVSIDPLASGFNFILLNLIDCKLVRMKFNPYEATGRVESHSKYLCEIVEVLQRKDDGKTIVTIRMRESGLGIYEVPLALDAQKMAIMPGLPVFIVNDDDKK